MHRGFQASDLALAPLRMKTWGHLIFLNFGAAGMPRFGLCSSHKRGVVSNMHADLLTRALQCAGGSLVQQLGSEGKAAMEAAGMTESGLVHVASRQYRLACNWKVFVDNYLVRTCRTAGRVCSLWDTPCTI